MMGPVTRLQLRAPSLPAGFSPLSCGGFPVGQALPGPGLRKFTRKQGQRPDSLVIPRPTLASTPPG